MANQHSPTASNVIFNKDHSKKVIPITFYQPHLCQAPKDYNFPDGKPLQKCLQHPNIINSWKQFPATSNGGENPTLNNQITNMQHQRLHSGACHHSVLEETNNSFERRGGSEHGGRCSTNEKDSNESVVGLRHSYLNESPVPVAVVTAPNMQMPLEGTKEPLTDIKFIEGGTFISDKSNATQHTERKPTTIERGYILWQLQSAGSEVLQLEMKMERTIEELTVPTLDNDAPG